MLDKIIDTYKQMQKCNNEIVSFNSWGVHLDREFFKKTFGTTGENIKREAATQHIRLETVHQGVIFFALFDYPKQDISNVEL